MRQTREFKNLLATTVNLDDTRLGKLDQRVESVFAALKKDDGTGSFVKDRIPQGSWAHRTIIKPAAGHEFDADFLLRMEEVTDWHDDPVRYLKHLKGVLDAHGTYGGMPVTRKHRCVRLAYAGDCHLDIVPFVRREDGTAWIIDGKANQWERTDPEGYTDWIRAKDRISHGNLRKVVRLLKFLRDRQGAFRGTKSVILTTLVGDRVEAWRTVLNPDYYVDVPTTLLHVVEDVDDWLQARPIKPTLADPSASGAHFGHRWTHESYARLREDMHAYRDLIRAAFHEDDPVTSRGLWQEIFGDGFDAPAERGPDGGRFGAVPAVPGPSGRAG